MQNIFEFNLNREADIAEGTYKYTLSDIKAEHNVVTTYGIKDKVCFTFELVVEEEIKTITKRFNYSKHPDSLFMMFMTIICNGYKTTKLNLQTLIGTKGELTIEHSTDEEGNVFENITEMHPSEIADVDM